MFILESCWIIVALPHTSVIKEPSIFVPQRNLKQTAFTFVLPLKFRLDGKLKDIE